MSLYSADGTINTTVVDGSTFTGLYAADGSINVVLDDTTYKGVYHPCGAFRVNSGTGSSVYDASGAYYSNYFFGSLLGTAFKPAAASLAIYAAFTTPPTLARKKLINNWVVATQSVWPKIDCWWTPAAADSQAALINWIAPGVNDLTVSGSPIFTADRGYAGDGGTGRLSGPNPSGIVGRKIAQDSAHIGVWLNTNVAEDNGEIGGSSLFIRARTTSNTTSGRVNDGTASTWFNSVTDSRGHTVGSRGQSGSYVPYKNGVAGTPLSVASTALLNSSFQLCSTNSSTSGTAIVGAGHIGSDLTAAEVLTLNNATLAYMQGIGAA